MASGCADKADFKSLSPQGVSIPLILITISCPLLVRLCIAEHTNCLATSLDSGATASSKSKITVSVGRLATFSMAREFAPGTYIQERRGL